MPTFATSPSHVPGTWLPRPCSYRRDLGMRDYVTTKPSDELIKFIHPSFLGAGCTTDAGLESNQLSALAMLVPRLPSRVLANVSTSLS